MIGLDTNVLVRYLTQDDAKQFQEASALLLGLEKQQRSAYLSTVTLCETVYAHLLTYDADINVLKLGGREPKALDEESEAIQPT